MPSYTREHLDMLLMNMGSLTFGHMLPAILHILLPNSSTHTGTMLAVLCSV